MGLDCIPSGRVLRPYPPPLCHLILARVSWRAHEELWDGHNLGQCAYHPRQHYNNIKALDTLNQKLFQLQMEEKETLSDWGVHLSRHLQVLATLFLEHFPPDCIAKLKCNHFYGRLPK